MIVCFAKLCSISPVKDGLRNWFVIPATPRHKEAKKRKILAEFSVSYRTEQRIQLASNPKQKRRIAVRLLRYRTIEKPRTDLDLNRRMEQLIVIAKALASEVESLQTEFFTDRKRERQIDLANDGFDFYREVERYEIELIKNALDLCEGNQARAAKLLTMKPTTLNAKMKHYGLNPVRSIIAQTK
jgi:DNA-binding protein Fis